MSGRFIKALVVGAALSLAAAAAHATDISGAGATFPYPIYGKWADAYKTATGIGLNYQSIGSGGGIKQIKAKTVDFGASDAPLEPKDLDQAGLIQFPMVMGGVVPVVNLNGVGPGQMKLTGPVLADIYLKKIDRWNDPAIAKLNPDLKLPDLQINVLHRSDGSGTTFNFANYLAQVSPEWKDKVGVNASLQWPVGVGAKGNEGVANYAKQINGSLGYVEYAYAVENKLAVIQLQNAAGKFVSPTAVAFQAAAANADWAKAPGFYLLLTNQPGAESWPITASTFILLYKQQDKPEVGHEVLKFFDWAYRNGGKMAEDLNYVPMPPSVIALVEKTWASEVKSADGKPVFSAGAGK
ncbi:MAG TPA: phosphate ABC transporter substrate-binding protein PstS [Candidatus Sulfotelmatobacter sp.]|nr:phosphate ABC transporter substrate-binding protein PstS [Candidatus Sulfotelmatobacter sp.]